MTTTTTTSSSPEVRYLSLADASHYCSVSLSTITRWVRTGRLRVFRPTRRPLVSVEDLDALIRGEGENAAP